MFDDKPLKDKYEQFKNKKSDINEHFSTLKKYSEECEIIVEMGVRTVVSTYALLMGKPKHLISIDFRYPSQWGKSMDHKYPASWEMKNEPLLMEAFECAKKAGINYQFILMDVLKIKIDSSDLLFIDTWHCYKQLISELTMHSEYVKKYIILHDTTTFELKDEDAYGNIDDSKKHGLKAAIEEFLEKNKHWIVQEKFTNNNGLTILKRVKDK